MTEFEAATIAFRNASLWAMYVQAGIAGLVGLAQCALIAYGLRLMRAGNDDRQRQADLAEKRHEENMLALQQQGEALRQQGKALETLIERTAQR